MPKFNKDLPKLTALQFPRVSHVHLGKIWAQIWAWQHVIFFLNGPCLSGSGILPVSDQTSL